MRRFGLVAFLSILAFAGTANAQPRSDKSNSQFDLHRNAAGSMEADQARGKMRAGDCAGALPLFDAAVRSSTDIEIVRDRGLCHDKLGDTYPALDDLRAYVAARPDASDAEPIRQRVQALQAAVDNDKTTSNTARPKTAAGETDVDVYASVREEEGQKKGQAIGAKPGEKEHDYSYYVKQEELTDEANSSSLRYGTGVVIGLDLNIPRYFFGSGGTSDFSYKVGGRLGYSLGTIPTLYVEGGLVGTGTAGEDLTATNGPYIGIGIEGRFGISKRASDQLLVRLAIDYEHYVSEQSRAILHVIPARFQFGYRHVFGPGVGLEFLVDGGPAIAKAEEGDAEVMGFVGGEVGLTLGF